MNDMAFRVFKLASCGFCCTQIMIKLALDDEGYENPDLIRALHGLCKGIGGNQKTCGVLIGGIAILGLYGGKGRETEFTHEGFNGMVDEYIEWFESKFNSTECMDIIGVYSFKDERSNENYMIKCGDVLLKGYAKAQEILSEYDFEYGSRE